jgi:hypothetical protein
MITNLSSILIVIIKKPSTIDKNKDVKILGKWVSNQQTNYKKKEQNMKDKEIYDMWTNFII